MKSKVATQEEIVDALSVFDSSANKDGYVDTSSLKHAMLQMGSWVWDAALRVEAMALVGIRSRLCQSPASDWNDFVFVVLFMCVGDERLSERECELFMEIADVNSDGKIQYRELVKYLTQ